MREEPNAVKPVWSGRAHRVLTALQLVPSLETGGAERATIDIASALVARGDRALVASEGGRLEAELARAGATLIKAPLAAKNPWRVVSNGFLLARLIRDEHVDIVHARSRAPAWSALIACRLTGTPFLTTFHGIYTETNTAKRFYNSVMARGDLVIANSRYTAGLIRERYRAPPERIVVIARGIDLERFNRDAIPDARIAALRSAWGLGAGRVVLNIARLTAWKGQRVLIEALATPPLAGRTDLCLVLVGDDQGRADYRRGLEALVETRGLGGRVKIVGHVDDVPAALALADLAVVASTEPEAFGRTVVEAAAMGTPVVATALGATGETVLAPPAFAAAGRTGWLIPPNDPKALGEAIAAALALLPEERAALAIRARGHAGNFTTQAMQAATLAVYNRLVSRAGNADSFSKR